MQIHDIHIRDWRGLHEVTLVDLPSSVALFGWNGQGKSSILDAVCYALLGYCRHTDRSGRGAEACIRDGAQRAVIRMTTDRFSIEVEVNAKDKNTREAVDRETGEIVDWPLLDRFAVPCLMPSEFLDDVGDLLSEWAAASVTPEAVREAVGPTWWAVTELVAERFAVPIDCIESIGDNAYWARRDANATVKKEQAFLDSLPHAPKPDVADRPTIVRGIALLEKKVRDLHQNLGAVHDMDTGALAKRHADLRAALAIAEAQRDAARVDFDNAQTTRLGTQAELEARQSKHAAATYRYTQLERAAKTPDTCPTCGRKMTAKAKETLAADMEACKQECADLLKAVSTQHEIVANARADESKARAGLEEAERGLVRAQTELDALPKPWDGPSREDIEAEISATEERLDDGRSMLEAWDQWQERDAAERRLATAQEEAEQMDWLTKAYKDGHVLYPLMLGALEKDFVEPVHETLVQWTGKSFAVEARGKQIFLTYGGRAVRYASEGERAMVQLAVAQAFGRQCGSPVLLDDANQLDVHWRRKLLQHLRTREGNTVMVAGAWQQSHDDFDAVQEALAPLCVVSVNSGRAVAHAKEMSHAV